MNDIVNEIHRLAAHYGPRSEFGQLIEEMSELMQAINKYYRALGHGQPTKCNEQDAMANIIEEIADVEVVLEQIKYLFGIDEHKLNPIKEFKVNRSVKRMEEEIKNECIKQCRK